MVVEIGAGNAADCARRLLSAIQSGGRQIVKRELARAGRVCERAAKGHSFAAEQAELLAAVVEAMRVSPGGEAEVFLLGHLAKS
jgi:hypothetical protein